MEALSNEKLLASYLHAMEATFIPAVWFTLFLALLCGRTERKEHTRPRALPQRGIGAVLQHARSRCASVVLMKSIVVALMLFCVCDGRRVEVESRGGQQPAEPSTRSITFVNNRTHGACNLFWVGVQGSGPRLFYGPLEPRGGSRTLEVFNGQVFALMEAGTYLPLAEFTITDDGPNQLSITDTNEAPPLPDTVARHREAISKACREAPSCESCAEVSGCGWSVVRRHCYVAHPMATTSVCEGIATSDSKSAEAWLNQGTALVLGRDEFGPSALHSAYRALERGLEVATKAAETAASEVDGSTVSVAAARGTVAKVERALAEVRAKLEAVFDDHDAEELLASTRHPALAQVHPAMPMVPRRTLDEAKVYIARGEPVIITDVFADVRDAATSPVTHKWTLEYLERRIFDRTNSVSATASDAGQSLFHVAANREGACCQYFEPRQKAADAGYPYPFAPTTHLYRDRFDGFVKTMRARGRTKGGRVGARMLHYLHEILMNAQGEAVVAGAPAPPALTSELNAMKTLLAPIASLQPFFGKFANAKLWLGQRGIILPAHHDATDNLYVMAWGRKRALVAEPGQMHGMYRYPNSHPLVGSSQVNWSHPSLERHPGFANVALREAVVGPGDVFYLPAFWWHQFEQPFEDSGALNFWSRDREGAPPDRAQVDRRVQELSFADHMESAVERQVGSGVGVALEVLTRGDDDDDVRTTFSQVSKGLHAAADAWRQWASSVPGSHPMAAKTASELVAEYLDHRRVDEVMRESRWPGWKPGDEWDLTHVAGLPKALRARCTKTEGLSFFASICR